MVKIDKINLDSFITKEGKDYRKAEEIEKEKIALYFSQQGYNVLNIEQLWRHVHGKLERKNEIFFFKMASTPGIGERTKNETSWNNEIHKRIKEAGINYFSVPEIFETGEYEGKFYYLSSFHDGPFLSSEDNTQGLEQWLEKIIKTNHFFLHLKNLNFYRDRGLKERIDDWDDFKALDKWYGEVEGHKLEKIYNEAKNLKNTYTPGINHGDFVPWHMIKERDKFVLIDSEHASGIMPKYLDICYFYHRLYTKANNPKLAKVYLNQVSADFSAQEKRTFEQSIKPILAMRIIGGFLDCKAHGIEDLSYHNRLRDDFLNNNLLAP